MIPGTITAKEDQATGKPIAFDYLENPYDDAFYYSRSPITQVSKIRVPVFVEDGWRDAFEAGDIRMFQALERRPGVATYLNIGPCTHKGCGGAEAPTDNPPGQDNVEAQEIRFDQRYLMGDEGAAACRACGSMTSRRATTSTRARGRRRRRASSASYLGPGAISARARSRRARARATSRIPSAGFSMSLDEQGTVAISPYVPTDQRLEDEQGLTWRTGPLTRR